MVGIGSRSTCPSDGSGEGLLPARALIPGRPYLTPVLHPGTPEKAAVLPAGDKLVDNTANSMRQVPDVDHEGLRNVLFKWTLILKQ